MMVNLSTSTMRFLKFQTNRSTHPIRTKTSSIRPHNTYPTKVHKKVPIFSHPNRSECKKQETMNRNTNPQINLILLRLKYPFRNPTFNTWISKCLVLGFMIFRRMKIKKTVLMKRIAKIQPNRAYRRLQMKRSHFKKLTTDLIQSSISFFNLNIELFFLEKKKFH